MHFQWQPPQTKTKKIPRSEPSDARVGTMPIHFKAIISSVRTTVDGGTRVSLDLPETHMTEAANLLMYVQNTLMDVSMTPQQPELK